MFTLTDPQFTRYLFGYNQDIDILSVPEAIVSDGGATYLPTTPTAANSVNIVSTSTNDTANGTGARTLVIEGLTTDYAPFTETITLNGTTNVNPSFDVLRINTATVKTVAVLGQTSGQLQ